jgi:hypothetical protein
MKWKVRGGTLILENGQVAIRRGRRYESFAIADLLAVDILHAGIVARLGCLGCLAWTGIGLLLAPFLLLPQPWSVVFKTRAGVTITVMARNKRDAIAIQAATWIQP